MSFLTLGSFPGVMLSPTIATGREPLIVTDLRLKSQALPAPGVTVVMDGEFPWRGVARRVSTPSASPISASTCGRSSGFPRVGTEREPRGVCVASLVRRDAIDGDFEALHHLVQRGRFDTEEFGGSLLNSARCLQGLDDELALVAADRLFERDSTVG